MHRVTSSLGGAPKNAACDAFGRAGIQGLVGGRLGAPPEWIDEGAVPAINAAVSKSDGTDGTDGSGRGRDEIPVQ
jgi:hypothetical protein